MKHFIFPLAALLAAASTPSVFAEESVHPTHVVELFTSQGCSSCPPANEFVTKLSKDSSVLVLSYGVTYWDYLGWEDTFGDPEFTQRQRDYRDAFGASNIYTPQIILSGSAHSPRYSKRDVADMALPESGVELSLARAGDVVTLTANTPKDVIIDIVSFTPGQQTVDVKRGENGGRMLKLTNVVTNIQTLELPKAEGRRYAALVHDKISAKILDAAIID